MKSYRKKQPIVEGSPAVTEHEAMMQRVAEEDAGTATDTRMDGSADDASAPLPTAGTSAESVALKQPQTDEQLKNVQTKIPLSLYEKLNHMKYFNGQRTSIADLVLQSIKEFVERHPV